jgi:hypothetical protein
MFFSYSWKHSLEKDFFYELLKVFAKDKTNKKGEIAAANLGQSSIGAARIASCKKIVKGE